MVRKGRGRRPDRGAGTAADERRLHAHRQRPSVAIAKGFRATGAQPQEALRLLLPCLDWSARRDHLAGELADLLRQHLVVQGWVRRGAGRDVAVTLVGQKQFVPLLANSGLPR